MGVKQQQRYAATTWYYLRGVVVNRTCGTHKNLPVSLFYEQKLVLFAMVPRNSNPAATVGCGALALERSAAPLEGPNRLPPQHNGPLSLSLCVSSSLMGTF